MRALGVSGKKHDISRMHYYYDIVLVSVVLTATL